MKIYAVEGLDLTGKSTLLKQLNDAFNANGHNSRINKGALTCEDYVTTEIENGMSRFEKDLYYTFLLTQDKHLPLAQDSEIILQDRYYPSVMFYGLLFSPQKSLANGISLDCYIQPDNFVYLKCSFEERLRRLGSRQDIHQDDLESLISKQEHEHRSKLFDQIMQRVNAAYSNVIVLNVDGKSPADLAQETLLQLGYSIKP